MLVLARVLFDVEVEFVRRVLVVGVDVVFFAIMTVPDVVLLDELELLVVDAVSWLVEVDDVGVLTRVDELVVVEPVLAVELIVANVVGAPEVSLVREVELAVV